MIEFKAECGHTIRAKDGDEGKVVRCSYCGRTCQVPDKTEDEFESLFSSMADLEGGETVSAGETIRTKRRRPSPVNVPGLPEPAGSFNPFAVVLKMAYAAGILIVLIVCAKFAYSYLTRDTGRPSEKPRVALRANRPDSPSNDDRSLSSSGKRGLLTVMLDKKKGGIYVNSVPSGAVVRYRKLEDGDQEDEGGLEELFADPRALKATTDSAISLEPGVYKVAVALRVNNQDLMRYAGYGDLRRWIENGGTGRPLEEYFLPDSAEEITTIDMPMQCWLARGYECVVTGTEWTPLTALFLPDGVMSDLVRYLPRQEMYGFDEDYVRGELSFYGVEEPDHTYIIDALRRVGMVMYRLEDSSSYRCFVIDPGGGTVTSRLQADTRDRGGGRSGRSSRRRPGPDSR